MEEFSMRASILNLQLRKTFHPSQFPRAPNNDGVKNGRCWCSLRVGSEWYTRTVSGCMEIPIQVLSIFLVRIQMKLCTCKMFYSLQRCNLTGKFTCKAFGGLRMTRNHPYAINARGVILVDHIHSIIILSTITILTRSQVSVTYGYKSNEINSRLGDLLRTIAFTTI